MSAAHSAGVVHGDLKPANLMVNNEGAVKVMDFGLARQIVSDRWHADTMVPTGVTGSGLSGTPGYMSPEVSRGALPTPASDVFALGLIIYEMLKGQPVVTGNNIFEVLRSIDRFESSQIVSEVSRPFADILSEALANRPEQRTITMGEIASRLA